MRKSGLSVSVIRTNSFVGIRTSRRDEPSKHAPTTFGGRAVPRYINYWRSIDSRAFRARRGYLPRWIILVLWFEWETLSSQLGLVWVFVLYGGLTACVRCALLRYEGTQKKVFYWRLGESHAVHGRPCSPDSNFWSCGNLNATPFLNHGRPDLGVKRS